MPLPEPKKVIVGGCPNCGKSRIAIVLEGSFKAIMCEGPNEYGPVWFGQCCRCLDYLESYPDDGNNTDKLEWNPLDQEKVEFLLGPMLAQTPPDHDPLRDSELDD